MAYIDQHRSRHRTATLTIVAALHGVAIYALITGLGVTYVTEIMPVLTGRNIPIEPPPPPPEPVRKKKTDDSSTVFTPQQPSPLPRQREPDLVPIGDPVPAPQPLPTFAADPPPLPKPIPSYAARGARPLGSPRDWVTADAYPARDLREGNQGTTRYALQIDADGRVSSCVVTLSSGHAGLDEAACRMITRHARFEAARDENGARTAGGYAGSVVWVIPAD